MSLSVVPRAILIVSRPRGHKKKDANTQQKKLIRRRRAWPLRLEGGRARPRGALGGHDTRRTAPRDGPARESGKSCCWREQMAPLIEDDEVDLTIRPEVQDIDSGVSLRNVARF